MTGARHVDEWHYEDGDVLWWHPGEAPWVGTPETIGQTVEMRHYVGGRGEVKTVSTDVGGWPGYHEWWTPLPERPAFPATPDPAPAPGPSPIGPTPRRPRGGSPETAP